MIGFHIGESTQTVSLNITLADALKNNPEYFREDVKIASFFGSPSLPWNGGRMILSSIHPDRVKTVIDAYNQRGIPYRFTFTNPSLTEEDIEDKMSNDILDMADNGMNEAIVYSPLLEEHIRKNHPKMKLTSSTCKCIRDMGELKAELAKDYSLVVLDFNFNNDFEKLEQLTSGERKKCEILVNAHCVPDCPRRAAHYKYIGDIQRRINEFRRMTKAEYESLGIKEWDCDYRKFNPFEETKTSRQIDPEDIFGKYAEMGFENFKLEGRATNLMVLCEQMVQYLAKPEKKDALRYKMMISALDNSYLNY